MSDIIYGLISETDARCLEKTIDLICEEMYWTANPVPIAVTEIGLYNCQTSIGVEKYISEKHLRTLTYTGIDNNRDKWIDAPKWMNFISGNSNEVYNQLPDESQHLIFIDGCHTFPMVVSDFFCYAPKVKVGGYIALHDTGKHLDPLSGWQGVGDNNDPDMCLGGVRKALQTIGLLEPFINPNYKNVEGGIYDQWDLIFDEADVNDTGGGICVFKKLY